MTNRSALVVDDERDIRELLVVTLARMGLRVETAATVAAAKQQLAHQEFDFCLTDMRLPDGTGMEVLAHIARHCPLTPVAVITAFGNVEGAVESLKAGAFDFVNKPVDLGVLRNLVKHALELRAGRGATVSGQPAGEARGGDELLGDSAPMIALRQTLAKVARSQAPVYIRGESGTGKELAARSLHRQSARAAGPFVPVNCGAIPAELMESEFFGHKKGSFTGAHADKEGLFQAAQGGTLFLDEVAELPLPMQVKLLRAIQEKRVRPVGAAGETDVDVRILSATHKDLARLVDEGKFRHDLYYRINVIQLCMPSLRERPEDLPLLARHALARLAAQHGQPAPALGPDALAALAAHPFPGNVRELENLLERAMALAEGETLTAADLALPAQPAQATHAPTPAEAATEAESAIAAPPGTTPPGTAQAGECSGLPLPDAIEQMERQTIEQALMANRYNKTRTAAQLGITFRALRYKLKKLGME